MPYHHLPIAMVSLVSYSSFIAIPLSTSTVPFAMHLPSLQHLCYMLTDKSTSICRLHLVLSLLLCANTSLFSSCSLFGIENSITFYLIHFFLTVTSLLWLSLLSIVHYLRSFSQNKHISLRLLTSLHYFATNAIVSTSRSRIYRLVLLSSNREGLRVPTFAMCIIHGFSSGHSASYFDSSTLNTEFTFIFIYFELTTSSHFGTIATEYS